MEYEEGQSYPDYKSPCVDAEWFTNGCYIEESRVFHMDEKLNKQIEQEPIQPTIAPLFGSELISKYRK